MEQVGDERYRRQVVKAISIHTLATAVSPGRTLVVQRGRRPAGYFRQLRGAGAPRVRTHGPGAAAGRRTLANRVNITVFIKEPRDRFVELLRKEKFPEGRLSQQRADHGHELRAPGIEIEIQAIAVIGDRA